MRSLMKRALVGACMLFASAVAANAGTLEVDVPFAFMVGSQHMPAGVYRIERDAPALVFVPDEGARRLTQVWGASAVGQEIPTGRDRGRLVGQIIVRGEARG